MSGGADHAPDKVPDRAAVAPPLGLLAELTHRCPLQCPYCYNPLSLSGRDRELSTESWQQVFEAARVLGVLQLHLSGGEPMARPDLLPLVAHASQEGLYSNLITSGVLLERENARALADHGLDHIQLSFQDTDPDMADRVSGYRDSFARKRMAAEAVRAADLPLTVNFVVHRQNLERLPDMIALALSLEAGRIEIAHVQYYGWALRNRAALMPTRAQIDRASEIVDAARAAHAGRLVIDYVVPDYYAARPKPCMGGWGRQFLVVAPDGDVLPCHAAKSIPGLAFENVALRPLADIWRDGPAFKRFRGTDWMREPCRGCAHRDSDFGGCRCQAMALTGAAENTDPACALSPAHGEMLAIAERDADAAPPPFAYRRFGS